ncbi:MAG: hypothetical protein ACREDT_07770 [Methylocella sp.]
MFKLSSPLAIAGALLSVSCLDAAAPAQALSKATFVSGKGVDTGTCSEAQPCRTFQFAINQTIAFGTVKVLDPANYGAMTITQSISIAGIEGAGINRSAGDAITINAGTNDVVNLTHLTIDGLKTGGSGIVVNSGGSLTITHCVVRNYANDGIVVQPTGKTNFLVADVVVSDNSGPGIMVRPIGAGKVFAGTLDHVLMNSNSQGLVVDSGATSAEADVVSVGSIAANNQFDGFFATGSRGALSLTHSVAFGNLPDVHQAGGIFLISFGDNSIEGFVVGTLTPIAPQ